MLKTVASFALGSIATLGAAKALQHREVKLATKEDVAEPAKQLVVVSEKKEIVPITKTELVPVKEKTETTTSRFEEITKFGTPESEKLSVKANFVSAIDYSKRQPRWVAEHITASNLQPKEPASGGNRENVTFKSDHDVPTLFRAENTDYFRSGYSRGHMAPASNNKVSQQAMEDTFFLNSNIVPQEYQNNADFWHRMESFARDLPFKHKNSDVYVVSGPLYLPEQEDNGKKYVKYQVIGENNVAVPTHLFKTIAIQLPEGQDASSDNKPQGKPESTTTTATEVSSTENASTTPQPEKRIGVAAFVVPNAPIPNDKKLTDYQVPLEQVEKSAGFILFPKLDRSRTTDLCAVVDCQDFMTHEQIWVYLANRILPNAKSLNHLNYEFEKLCKEKPYLKEEYQKIYDRVKTTKFSNTEGHQ